MTVALTALFPLVANGETGGTPFAVTAQEIVQPVLVADGWSFSCDPVIPLCRASAGAVHIWLVGTDGRNDVFLQIDWPGLSELTLVGGNRSPLHLFAQPIQKIDLEVLQAFEAATRLRVVAVTGQFELAVPPLASLFADQKPAPDVMANRRVEQDQDSSAAFVAQQEAFQRAHEVEPYVFIPRTKPQVEFAIRAQDGESVFDPTGHLQATASK